jgi:hypothetical protein
MCSIECIDAKALKKHVTNAILAVSVLDTVFSTRNLLSGRILKLYLFDQFPVNPT